MHKPGAFPAFRSLIRSCSAYRIRHTMVRAQIMCFASHRMRMTTNFKWKSQWTMFTRIRFCLAEPQPESIYTGTRTGAIYFKYLSFSRFSSFPGAHSRHEHEISRYEYITAVSCCRDYAGQNVLDNGTARHITWHTSAHGTAKFETYFVIAYNHRRCASKTRSRSRVLMAASRPHTIEFHYVATRFLGTQFDVIPRK